MLMKLAWPQTTISFFQKMEPTLCLARVRTRLMFERNFWVMHRQFDFFLRDLKFRMNLYGNWSARAQGYISIGDLIQSGTCHTFASNRLRVLQIDSLI